MTYPFLFKKEPPKMVRIEKGDCLLGYIEEIVSNSEDVGAGLAKVTLNKPDILHYHEETTEVYYCLYGHGQIALNHETMLFQPGNRVVIKPGTKHAVSPLDGEVVFLCLSVPTFNQKDFIEV